MTRTFPGDLAALDLQRTSSLLGQGCPAQGLEVATQKPVHHGDFSRGSLKLVRFDSLLYFKNIEVSHKNLYF